MSADQNIETIKPIYEAFGLGDVEAILAKVTDDVRVEPRWSSSEARDSGFHSLK
jgi:ketosteroid isomerase-like protein